MWRSPKAGNVILPSGDFGEENAKKGGSRKIGVKLKLKKVMMRKIDVPETLLKIT